MELGRLVSKAERFGYGYEADSWQRSELAAWLRMHGAELTLYSNNPAALWHLSHRPSRLLPLRHEANPLFGFRRRFLQRPSALVELPHDLESQGDDEGIRSYVQPRR